MDNASAHSAREAYNIAYWSGDYFDVTPAGHLIARPDGRRHGAEVDLFELVGEIRRAGLALPVLVRFINILHDRVDRLCRAFRLAMAANGYTGSYTAAYPIKVNQQRRVVQEILSSGANNVGLECGSKPELMGAIAVSPEGGRIICNGYKDREYIRLALRSRQLGLDCWIIVEKYSEIELILAESRRLGVQPRLGLRVRLASIGEGKWQNTGGEKSKFGLSAAQALAVVERLRAVDMLARLQMLHFHLGSQIPNIADIQRAMREAARYYVELHRLGAAIECVDVGGGLGVDYEGTRSRSFCSMNYTLEEYAHNIVHTLGELASAAGLRHPDIVTESGRAMTAHHAVLITDVIDVDRVADATDLAAPSDEAPLILRDLWRGLADGDRRSPLEAYHDACHYLYEAHGMYTHGLLSLAQRAQAERIYQATCARVQSRLDPKVRAHRDVLDELNEKLADKLFGNFSLFQSMPDIWAIDQLFPILPLHRLNEPLARRCVLQDLTCDSDGAIRLYVDRAGVERTLPLPVCRSGEPLLLGVFLVGAYQEILGDIHNLFGDTDSV
ncbi:MAG: biosynthetic arginine decarboxylase, partial [Nitrococcus sp.]|nr:biosynthetic arginine decarboxylase [Nitrococcus sp.]